MGSFIREPILSIWSAVLAGQIFFAWTAHRIIAAEKAAPTKDTSPVYVVPRSEIPDAATEGWTSENYADAAQARLKEWLLPLTKGERVLADVRGRFQLTPILKQAAPVSGWTIWRASAPTSEITSTLQEALKPLLAKFESRASLHLKVKTLGVEKPQDGKPGKTTHLVHLDGPHGEGRREINATWVATWEKDDSLRSLVSSSSEEVLASKEATRFTDQTATVLDPVSSAGQQFAAGIPYYRLKLQSSLPFNKFGHHGVSIADVNGDGLEDVYVCAPGGLPNRLLLHQPDGSVKEAATAWGIDLLDPCQTALFADFDNDGDPDLAVATQGPLAFFENTGKRFEPRLRLRPVSNCYGLAAADYDLDGDVDLYAIRYYATESEGGELAVPAPFYDANNGGANFLIRNDGGSGETWRKFSDSTAECGLNEGTSNRRFSYAAVWEDINNDGWPDLYVANDFGKNNLFIQQKLSGASKFKDITEEAGMSAGAFGMSASSADINRDGKVDLHLGAMWSSAGNRITEQANFRSGQADPELRARFRRLARGNTLFLNQSSASAFKFNDISMSAGITVGRWSWASIFGDINADGWPDLLVANGFISGERPDDL